MEPIELDAIDLQLLDSLQREWPTAAAQIQQGADFVIHNEDAAGLGVFQAAQERGQAAQARGVLAFGTNKNQNEIAPDVILASAVIDIPGAFLRVAQEVKDKRFRAGITPLAGAGPGCRWSPSATAAAAPAAGDRCWAAPNPRACMLPHTQVCTAWMP